MSRARPRARRAASRRGRYIDAAVRDVLVSCLSLASGCLWANPDFDGARASASGGHTSGALTSTSGAPTTSGPDPGASVGLTSGTGTSTTGVETTSSSAGATTSPPAPDLGGGGSTTGAPGDGCAFDPAKVGPASPLAPLNSMTSDYDPWLTADGKTLYFASDRAGNGDSFRAERAGPGALFGDPPTSNDDLNINTSASETKVVLTEDALRYYVSSTKDQTTVIFTATRGLTDEPFGPRVALDLQPGANFFDPHLGPKGKRLYAAPNPGLQRLAWWVGEGEAWAAPPFDPFAAIHDLDIPVADPTLSADERVLIFSGPSEEEGDSELWYARRDGPDDSFDSPTRLSALNTADDEGSPHLSADGCELFFHRSPKGAWNPDLYLAPIGP